MFEKALFTQHEELEDFLLNSNYIPWEKLENARLFITGATGLVGSCLTRALLYANEKLALGLRICALVRDPDKARAMLPASEALVLLRGDLDSFSGTEEPVDYIVHAASPTASKYFMTNPVETIETAVGGTMKILALAKEKQVKSLVYLSSMEVYGDNHSEEPLMEEDGVSIRPLSIRSCYPVSKLLCENLCISYYHEYNLPCRVLRLAQTFGPGTADGDQRVFAQFARAVIGGTDIRLETAGTTKQCYLYTMDAVSAILTALLCADGGQAYNAANPATYCSIREMAELVAGPVAGHGIAVHVNDGDPKEAAAKYPPTHQWNLSVEKLCAAGWKPHYDLPAMYERLISYMVHGW